MSLSRDSRVVAIDPTAKGFGYTVLEGSERLLDWGVCEVEGERAFSARLKKLFDYADPEALIVENLRRSRRSGKALVFVRAARLLARRHGISVAAMSRKEVDGHFSASENKFQIALTVARFFPELEDRLPRERKPWRSEDERMAIFDSLSFALTALWNTSPRDSD